LKGELLGKKPKETEKNGRGDPNWGWTQFGDRERTGSDAEKKKRENKKKAVLEKYGKGDGGGTDDKPSIVKKSGGMKKKIAQISCFRSRVQGEPRFRGGGREGGSSYLDARK